MFHMHIIIFMTTNLHTIANLPMYNFCIDGFLIRVVYSYSLFNISSFLFFAQSCKQYSCLSWLMLTTVLQVCQIIITFIFCISLSTISLVYFIAFLLIFMQLYIHLHVLHCACFYSYTHLTEYKQKTLKYVNILIWAKLLSLIDKMH